jgi:hypothetical protein
MDEKPRHICKIFWKGQDRIIDSHEDSNAILITANGIPLDHNDQLFQYLMKEGFLDGVTDA